MQGSGFPRPTKAMLALTASSRLLSLSMPLSLAALLMPFFSHSLVLVCCSGLRLRAYSGWTSSDFPSNYSALQQSADRTVPMISCPSMKDCFTFNTQEGEGVVAQVRMSDWSDFMFPGVALTSHHPCRPSHSLSLFVSAPCVACVRARMRACSSTRVFAIGFQHSRRLRLCSGLVS